MFDAIKRRWAEARAGVAAKEADDILLRYQQMDSNSRYFVSSAFASVLSDWEEQFGPMESWDRERKMALAKELLAEAQQALRVGGDTIHAQTSRLGAHGGALLALYLELQTLPGEKAREAVESIQRWKESI